MKTLSLFLARLYWQWRYAHAKQYRNGMEAVMRHDIALAQYDMEHCELQLARSEIAIIAARADRKLA